MDEVHRHYLRDLGYLIRENAIEAKRNAIQARSTKGEGFEAGRLLAYFEVVSLMISQAATFGLPAEDLAMKGFVPDHDLMSG